jgi:anti-sigma regulatory factor (Ser/Thr protein kinase)
VGSPVTRVAEFRIGNDLSEIGDIRDGLDRLGQEVGVPARPLMQLQVALDEVVSNVVKYAWGDGGQHELLVRITVKPGKVDVEICDDGREFDPRSVPAPDPIPAGRLPRPGGLGLHMVRKLVDEFTYERVGGRNHTRLSKFCEVGDAIKESDE